MKLGAPKNEILVGKDMVDVKDLVGVRIAINRIERIHTKKGEKLVGFLSDGQHFFFLPTWTANAVEEMIDAEDGVLAKLNTKMINDPIVGTYTKESRTSKDGKENYTVYIFND